VIDVACPWRFMIGLSLPAPPVIDDKNLRPSLGCSRTLRG
jgi:hypothetical protein